MRSRYRIYSNEAIHFVTSTIVEWIPIFVSQPYFKIMTDSIKYCQENKGLHLYAYVIMDNHFHFLCSAPQLSRVMQSMKRHTGVRLIHQLEADHREWLLHLFAFFKKQHKEECRFQIWQEGFHPQEMTNDDMLYQKLEYIHKNPVKRGLVERAEYWYFSSAGDYMLNRRGPITVKRLWDDESLDAIS